MAEPFFKILVVRSAVEPPSLQNSMFRDALKKRLLDEFNAVAAASRNTKVKTGFAIEFIAGSDARASRLWSELPKNVFRVHLIPQKVDISSLLALQKKIAPHFDGAKLTAQMKAEGGIGGRKQNRRKSRVCVIDKSRTRSHV